MSIELPDAAVAVLNVAGLQWPCVDEDQLRGWAGDLRGFSGEITTLAGESNQAVAAVAAGSESVFTQTLGQRWDHHRRLIEDLRGPMEVFAGALDAAADAVEVQKGVIIAAAAALAAEFTATQIGAFFTAGADEAAVGPEVAVFRLAVKAALQYLEGELIGQLCNAAAGEISNQLGQTILHLVGSGVQIAGTAAAFKTDLDALNHLAGALTGHGQRADSDGHQTASRTASRPIETPSPCGRWPVAQIVEAMLTRVGEQLFRDLPQALEKILGDTVAALKDAVRAIRNKDDELAQEARQVGEAGTVATVAGAGTAAVAGVGVRAALRDGDEVAQEAGHAGESGAVTTAVDGGETAAASGTGAAALAGRGEAAESAASPGTVDVRPAAGERLTAPRSEEQIPACKDPIDAATGAVIMHQVDAELPGVLPLVVERSYCSSYPGGRWFGPGWASTLDQRLVADTEGMVLLTADGRRLCYPHLPDGAGEVLPEAGARWPLRRGADGTGYVVTDLADGRTLMFGSHGGADEFLLDQVADRNGNRVTFGYGADGTPQKVEHSGGYQVAVTISSGRVAALALAGAGPGGADVPLVRFEYADGHLAQVVNSSGQPLEFGYDAAGRMTGWKDRNGCWYRYRYDAEGRCVQAAGPDEALSAEFSYESGRTTVTGPDGSATAFDLDDNGLVLSETAPGGAVTRYQHDATGQITARTDPLGRTTRYQYGGHGQLTELTRPDGSRLHIGYAEVGAAHLPSTVTEPDGGTWRYDRDDRGNVIAVTVPDGTDTRYSYSDRGALTAVTGPDGEITRITADPAGLPLTITAPDGAVTAMERDGSGRVTAVTGPAGDVTRYDWTIEGKLARVHSPDGAREEATYDGEGNLTRHTGAAGQVTEFAYTHFDLPASVIAPDGGTWRYGYDHELRLTSVTNPADLTWRYDYDADGRLTAETDFNGRTVGYAYDAAGQLTSKINGAGQQIRYSYDDLGNLTRQEADGEVTTFSYDPLGRLTRARNADADLLITRDLLGRALKEAVNGAGVTSRYDEAGRRTGRTTPSGAFTHWNYDRAGRPATLIAGGHQIAFSYDAAGRETTRRIGAGVTLTQEWDSSDRLTAQVLARADVAGGRSTRVLQERHYQWAPGDLLASVDDQITGARSYQHDSLGRITAVTGATWQERYSYDPAENIAAAHWPTRVPDAEPPPRPEASGHRTYQGTLLRSAGALDYRYDKQGRVISQSRKRLSRKPAIWRYTWDAADRLTAVITPEGTAWRYQYDPLGRRIAKQHLAADGTVASETRFRWDGPLLAEQATTHGPNGCAPDGPAEVLTWEYKPGTFTPLTQAHHISTEDAPQDWVDNQFWAIITSNTGAPAELITPDGDLAWHQPSTIWGAPTHTAEGRDTAYTPLRFPGQYEDEETGWSYNHHRYYDPATARYATPDPLGLPAGTNPHAYVKNPNTHIDPLGLTPCPISMDRAVELASQHVGGEGRVVVSGSRGYQFINTTVENSGHVTTKIARFDINAYSPHVRKLGPHLNLETQINGVTVTSGRLADPHYPIDPATIRAGDIP